MVVPPGIEPGTQGFSVLCSTNWAMAPSQFWSSALGILLKTDAKVQIKLTQTILLQKKFAVVAQIFFQTISVEQWSLDCFFVDL